MGKAAFTPSLRECQECVHTSHSVNSLKPVGFIPELQDYSIQLMDCRYTGPSEFVRRTVFPIYDNAVFRQLDPQFGGSNFSCKFAITHGGFFRVILKLIKESQPE
jgi:hypothetical protein